MFFFGADNHRIGIVFFQLLRIIQFEACNARLTLALPPKLALTPRELSFGGAIWDFNAGTATFLCRSGFQNECDRYVVESALDPDTYTPGGETRDDFYRVIVRKFRRGQGPDTGQSPGALYGLKMTFQPSIPNAAVNDMLSYVNNGANNKDHVFVGNVGCSPSGTGGYLCLKTTATMYIPNSSPLPEGRLTLLQRISKQGIFIEGNVAAPGNLNGFSINSDAIAVGGSVTVTGGSASVPNYLSTPRTFKWDQVSSQLNGLHARGMNTGTTVSPARFSGDTYQGNAWRLNAATDDPLSAAISTFAAPPEGKIWRRSGSLILNQPTQFIGSGTIVVNGNLTINQPITCSNTRLAFLVSGNININTNSIGCGSYTALGGNIVFANAISGTINGIFVARSNIDLPDPNQLLSNYSITYDSFLAANPTALLKELLEIITTATS